MSKNMKRYLVILAIVLVVYNLLVFVIPFPRECADVFWIAWAGGLVAILSQGYTAYLAFNKKESLKSMLYGFPIVRIGAIYLIAQLVVTLLCFIIGAFVAIPAWIIILVEVILLALAAIGVISSETYREEIEKMEVSAPLSTQFVYGLRVDTKLLHEKYKDSPVDAILYELAEEVRFSDPKSSEELIDIEDEINRRFIELKEVLLNCDFGCATERAESLIALVKERNYRCKLSKK